MPLPPAAPFAESSLFAVDSRRILRVALPPAAASRDPEVRAELQRLGAWHPAPPPLLVDGDGSLSQILRAGGAQPLGADLARAQASDIPSAAILVSVADGPAPERWSDIDARAREHGWTWLCAWIEGPAAFVSPLLESPEDPGFADTVRRRRATEAQPAARAALLEHQRRRPAPPAAALAHATCAQITARLATPAVRAAARRTLVVIQPGGAASEHRVLPWPRGIQEDPIP